jgi:hypothetical protein
MIDELKAQIVISFNQLIPKTCLRQNLKFTVAAAPSARQRQTVTFVTITHIWHFQ